MFGYCVNIELHRCLYIYLANKVECSSLYHAGKDKSNCSSLPLSLSLSPSDQGVGPVSYKPVADTYRGTEEEEITRAINQVQEHSSLSPSPPPPHPPPPSCDSFSLLLFFFSYALLHKQPSEKVCVSPFTAADRGSLTSNQPCCSWDLTPPPPPQKHIPPLPARHLAYPLPPPQTCTAHNTQWMSMTLNLRVLECVCFDLLSWCWYQLAWTITFKTHKC